jgi:hypothetical protein
MTTITTTCPQGITAEQIAALRDGALDLAEAERLRAHIATCPTCQATQASYEAVAHTLAAQRIPTPDARLWRGVQARLGQRPARALPLPPRAIWGGAGALASVIVLAILFAQVFGHLSGTSTSYHTTGPQGTQTAAITPAPTAVDPTTFIRPAQAWGSQYITDQRPLGTTLPRSLDVLSPDASFIAGTVTRAGHQCIATLDTRTQTLHIVYTAASDLQSPFQVLTDGRYIVWSGGNGGEAAQTNHNILGYADLQTGQVKLLAEIFSFSQPLSMPIALNNGILLWYKGTQMTSANPLGTAAVATNLASGVTTPLPAITTNTFVDVIAWPDALLEQVTPGSYQFKWQVLNVLTGQVIDAPGIPFADHDNTLGFANPLALVGSRAYTIKSITTPGQGAKSRPSVTAVQMEAIPDIYQAQRVVQTLGEPFQGTTPDEFIANGRLVVFGKLAIAAFPAPSTIVVWDAQEQRLISFDPNQFVAPHLYIRENALIILDAGGDGKQAMLDIINTNTLPTAPPGA